MVLDPLVPLVRHQPWQRCTILNTSGIPFGSGYVTQDATTGNKINWDSERNPIQIAGSWVQYDAFARASQSPGYINDIIQSPVGTLGYVKGLPNLFHHACPAPRSHAQLACPVIRQNSGRL
jgi:hypothetical protein